MKTSLLSVAALSIAACLLEGCTPDAPIKRTPANQTSQAETASTTDSPDHTPIAVSERPGKTVVCTRRLLSDNVYLETVRDDLPLSYGYAGMVSQAFLQAGWQAGNSAACNISPTAAMPMEMSYCQEYRGGSKRRVLVRSWVCLRQGFLEHFLSRPFKAHESILATEVDAQAIHVGLLATGANPGQPVQWINEKGDDDYHPPAGDEIKITLRYEDQGRVIEVPAQRWIRDSKAKKELQHHWVFAGSRLFEHPDGPQHPRIYAANDGRIICTANFTTALLDLPVVSKPGDPTVGLDWEANTPQIPPRDTTVLAVLEPLRPANSEKK
jgi:hypothetical protein